MENFTKYGTNYGGYYIPNDNKFNVNSIVYDIGIGEEISFNIELVDIYGCNIYMFDPTLKSKNKINNLKNDIHICDENNEYFHYIKKVKDNMLYNKLQFYNHGVYTEDTKIKFYTPKNKNWVSGSLLSNAPYVSDDYEEIEVYKLDTIMNNLKHTNIDLLKIDAGGCECEIVLQLLNSNVIPKILLVLHNNHVYGDDKVNEFITKMKKFNYKELRYPENIHKITYVLQ